MNELNIARFPPLSYAGTEAVNALCTNLSFSGPGVRKIMITSCHSGEGKSCLSMNLMRTLARLGKVVTLVDADLRRSTLASRYGFQFRNSDQRLGLAHYLAARAAAKDVIYRTNLEGAYLVPLGREVSNPLPLLSAQRFERLLDELARQSDYVLVDVPPVGMVIDAAQIAKYCDGTLIVVDYNSVHRRELIGAKNQLEQTGCPILGTVLNRVDYNSYLSKKYYYKSHDSGNGSAPQPDRRRGRL
ncbi:MAG: CpsD/CapB family tyrosine-protein kinase [Aristaeellaceae bacterium]